MNRGGDGLLLLLMLFSLVITTTLFEFGWCSKDKKVNIVLKSNWPSYPMHLEASEYFGSSSSNDEAFWLFFESFSFSSSFTDLEVYNNIINIAKDVLGFSDTKLSLLKWSLSIHFENPKLEMYRHLANQEIPKEFRDFRSPLVISSGGKVITSIEELQRSLSSSSSSSSSSNLNIDQNPQLFPFDHIYHNRHLNYSTHFILYGHIGEPITKEFHNILSTYQIAQGEKIVYVFRHLLNHYSSLNEGEDYQKLNLQGFGVDLALKSLEYKVIDDTKRSGEGEKVSIDTPQGGDELPVQGFNFNVLTKNYPELSSELLSFKAHLLSEEFELEKMKVWEIKDLGLVASQRIKESKEPLRLLRDISQNLPTLAHSLARQGIDSASRSTLLSTLDQLNMLGLTRNLIWINRILYDPSSLNPFQLFNELSKQMISFDSMKALYLNNEDIYKVLSINNNNEGNGGVSIVIDVYSELTDWVNNMESDVRYISWNRRVRDLLQPVWPGQFHYVRKHFFNIVVVIDPASTLDLSFAQYIVSLVWQNLPARVGFLFDLKDEQSEISLRVWKYLRMNWSISTLFQYLTQISKSNKARITNEVIQESLSSLIGDYFSSAVNSKDHDIDNYIQQMHTFVRNKSLDGMGPLFFVNGHLMDVSSVDTIIDPLVTKIFQLRSELQELVMTDQITEDTEDIYLYLSKRPEVSPNFARLIIPTNNQKPQYVPVHKHSPLIRRISYLNSPSADDLVHGITHLLLVDLNTQEGKHIAREAISRLEKGGITMHVRAGFISCSDSNILRGIDAVVRASVVASKYLPIVKELLNLEDSSDSSVIEVVQRWSSIQISKFEHFFVDEKNNWDHLLEQQRLFCSKEARLEAGQNAIITSGRIIVVPPGTFFSDFEVLENYEFSTRLSSINNIIQDVNYEGVDADLITSPFISNTLQDVVSILAEVPDRSTSQTEPPLIEPSFEVKSERATTSTTDLSILVILDPLSTAAQRVTPILMGLIDIFNCHLKVILNPARSLSDMPLKNFYRYQMETLGFDENGKLLPAGIATFANVPQARLLSTTISVPSSWLVLPSKCVYDLDNIVLKNLPPGESSLYAEFTLQNILLEGSCSDMSNRGVPPRGLELILGDNINPHQQDSLVMSNLGYFQLKANPGIWYLQLAPGRASTIYQIRDKSKKVAIMKDFIGEKELLHVEKKSGMERVSLFDDLTEKDNSGGSGSEIWQTITGIFGRDRNKIKSEETEKDGTIHIFSLASGHLYERFLKIMMLTVVKNTQSPVKFWLLSNFLSPAFKEFVPQMATKYGFQVELVTYKWPAWLHEQTEKQRIIWGYKILFLDVLFPLNLTRVIYVDADQIVRVDLKELRDMNLNGAPYGYTPFCSGNTMNRDTTGFRFWDSGYWRDHLSGKPYHISALYVIDLLTLRQRGYADQLRATYDGLSKDPNSLANLDQDLPNYLQHIVPIYSLPQEWLWCETWCTMDSKSSAKTIDLCNNPLTKTPKLEAAVKLIPEWTDWDTEIKDFELSLQDSATTTTSTISTATTTTTTTKLEQDQTSKPYL